MTVTHNAFLDCRDHIHAALTAEMRGRAEHQDWIERERLAVTVAANNWAEAHGLAERVTVDDVEAVEVRAVGHSDYGTKFALYVAELITGRAPHHTSSRR